jgi:hypothetical protein
MELSIGRFFDFYAVMACTLAQSAVAATSMTEHFITLCTKAERALGKVPVSAKIREYT